MNLSTKFQQYFSNLPTQTYLLMVVLTVQLSFVIWPIHLSWFITAVIWLVLLLKNLVGLSSRPEKAKIHERSLKVKCKVRLGFIYLSYVDIWNINDGILPSEIQRQGDPGGGWERIVWEMGDPNQDQHDVCHKNSGNLVDITIGLAIKF